MTKMLKNSKQIFAFVIAFAVIAVSLFTGVTTLTADAASATNSTIYWDGTVATSFSDTSAGTEGDPIEIKTAAELALMVTKNDNKYYKVADGIKKIILQKESDAAAVLAITDGDNAKTVFNGIADPLAWADTTNGKSFKGHFDGNGAAIYGIYKDAISSWCASALFPKVDAGSTFKNFAVRNSYVVTWAGVSTVVAETSGGGKLSFDSIEVSNNYLAAGHTGSGRIGIFAKGGNGNTYTYNNIITYGNNGYQCTTECNTDTLVPRNYLIGACQNDNPGSAPDFTNSIILGCAPGISGQKNMGKAGHFNNVYTDCLEDFITNCSWSGAAELEGIITNVTVTTGEAVKAAMPTLDWTNVFIATDGAPALRSFHNLSLTQTAMKHYEECADCGLKGAEENHTYNTSYKCTVCAHQCLHDGAHGMTSVPTSGDCVTAAGTYVTCPCGYTNNMITGAAPTGHVLVHHEANAGHCQEDAIAEHWTCEVCNKIFLTADIWAGMDTSVDEDDPSYNFGLGSHQKVTDAEGFKIFNDETGHWYECSVCDGRLDDDSNKIADTAVIEHKFKNGACRDCGWTCDEHDFQKTGVIVSEGDCTTDRQEQVKCSVCQLTGYEITKEAGHTIVFADEVAPTDKMEGTKAHYECEVCGEIFVDAEGKTKAEGASLVIPKTIEANGLSNITGGDTSSTSPATSDNIVIAVTTVSLLAGAAFIVIRKFKKA